MKVLLFLLCIACVRADVVQRALDSGMEPWSLEFVELINKSNLTWQAKQNFKGWDRERLKLLVGTYPNADQTDLIDVKNCYRSVTSDPVPEKFDAREEWPHCSDIIGHVRDQSNCKSCWAVSSAATISDRICIASKGKQKVQISALDIMTCSRRERYYSCNNGGQISQAYKFWKENGIVSGGDFGDYSTCRPYPLNGTTRYSSNFIRATKLKSHDYSTFMCLEKCFNGKNYGRDNHWAKEICRVQPKNEKAIQREIMAYGSVTATFYAFKTLFSYGEGVYQHDSTDEPRKHAIKLFGWGIDGGVKYWRAANSWGTDWGSDKGLFKFIRGENNCGIEENVLSGIAEITAH